VLVVPDVPELPDVPEVPDVPDVPDVPELPDVPEPPELPPDELPLLLPVSLALGVDEQADRPSAMASKPASTTLWCCCFMMDPPLILSVGMRDDDVCHFGKRRKRARRSS
jgi:hypothetical protein